MQKADRNHIKTEQNPSALFCVIFQGFHNELSPSLFQIIKSERYVLMPFNTH